MNRRFHVFMMVVGLVTLAAAGGCGGAQPEAGDQQQAASGDQDLTVDEKADYYMEQAGMALAEDDKQLALENYLEAARVRDEHGDVNVERAEAHFLAADLAYQIGEKLQAIEEYQAAVDIYQRFSGNSKIKAAVGLNNMGTIYKETEQPGKARNCWEDALQIYKEAPPDLQSPSNMAKIQQNINDLDEGF